MPQVVAPWTWRRLLRDYGPADDGFLLAMLVLGTWMDGEGYAWPSQPTWAKGARKSTRMIQRYVGRAVRDGWLSVTNAGRGGKGWRHNAYRCCAPDYIPLDEKDAQIGTALEAQCGEIERHDTLMSSASANGGDTRMSPARAKGPPMPLVGDDMASMKVTTSEALGDDTAMSPRCRHNDVALSLHLTPALRTHALEEARLAPSACVGVSTGDDQKTEAQTKHRQEIIAGLLKGGHSVTDIVRFTRTSGVTLEEVQRIAEQQSAKDVF